MTNKPGLLGSITACVVAGVLAAVLATVRLRVLAVSTREDSPHDEISVAN